MPYPISIDYSLRIDIFSSRLTFSKKSRWPPFISHKQRKTAAISLENFYRATHIQTVVIWYLSGDGRWILLVSIANAYSLTKERLTNAYNARLPSVYCPSAVYIQHVLNELFDCRWASVTYAVSPVLSR